MIISSENQFLPSNNNSVFWSCTAALWRQGLAPSISLISPLPTLRISSSPRLPLHASAPIPVLGLWELFWLLQSLSFQLFFPDASTLWAQVQAFQFSRRERSWPHHHWLVFFSALWYRGFGRAAGWDFNISKCHFGKKQNHCVWDRQRKFYRF